MNKLWSPLFFLISLCIFTQPSMLWAKKPFQIISVSDLKKGSTSRYIILDARNEREYEAAHPKGSLHFSWEEWTEQKPSFFNWVFGSAAKWGRVPEDIRQVQDRLRELGLDNNSRILIVGQPKRFGAAGRVAWNLLYWGAEDVSLLDGGMRAWIQGELALESGSSKRKIRPGKFSVQPVSWRLATLKQVQAFLESKGVVFLDARSKSEFKGKKERGQKRGGHIPGARLVSLVELYNEDSTYIGAEKLRRLLGEVRDKKIITYCTGGVRSALLSLLIEDRLGIKSANYAGSIWEWSALKDLPLDREGL